MALVRGTAEGKVERGGIEGGVHKGPTSLHSQIEGRVRQIDIDIWTATDGISKGEGEGSVGVKHFAVLSGANKVEVRSIIVVNAESRFECLADFEGEPNVGYC